MNWSRNQITQNFLIVWRHLTKVFWPRKQKKFLSAFVTVYIIRLMLLLFASPSVSLLQQHVNQGLLMNTTPGNLWHKIMILSLTRQDRIESNLWAKKLHKNMKKHFWVHRCMNWTLASLVLSIFIQTFNEISAATMKIQIDRWCIDDLSSKTCFRAQQWLRLLIEHDSIISCRFGTRRWTQSSAISFCGSTLNSIGKEKNSMRSPLTELALLHNFAVFMSKIKLNQTSLRHFDHDNLECILLDRVRFKSAVTAISSPNTKLSTARPCMLCDFRACKRWNASEHMSPLWSRLIKFVAFSQNVSTQWRTKCN